MIACTTVVMVNVVITAALSMDHSARNACMYLPMVTSIGLIMRAHTNLLEDFTAKIVCISL